MSLTDVELSLIETIRKSLEELHVEKGEIDGLVEKATELAQQAKKKRSSSRKEEGERIVDAADADTELKQQIQALLSSETGYIGKLDQIVTEYLIPLRVGSDSVKMKTQATVDIFSNVDILASIHHEFHNNLKACYEKFPLLPIGELFLKTVPSLELYTQFVNNFSNAINTLHIEDKRSKSFHQFLLAKEEKNGMGLEALLSVPLNRIAHYRAIFTNIFGLTARNSPDYKNMVDIMESLESLQEQINKSLTQSHSMAKIIAVEQRVQGRENVSLRDFNREFVHEGALAIADGDSKKVKDKEAYFFLFNDILLYAKRLPQKNLSKFKKIIKLQHATLSHDGLRINLRLHDDDTPTLTLLADNDTDKMEWVTALGSVLSAMEATKVFEVALETLVERESESLLPSFVDSLIKRIEDAALETAGIFRVSASKVALNSVKALVDRGIAVEVAFLDDHVVSGLLKEFFRSLPEPVIPFALYDRLMDCASADDPVISLKELVEAMPPANAALLKRLMGCLVKVASKSAVNMMGPSNLAIVIGPNLARAAPFDPDNPMAEIGFSASGGPLIEKMITHYDDIFPRDARTFAKAMPKSMVYSKDMSTITTAAGPLLGGTRHGRKGSPDSQSPEPAQASTGSMSRGQNSSRGGFDPSMIAAAANRMKQGSSGKLPKSDSPPSSERDISPAEEGPAKARWGESSKPSEPRAPASTSRTTPSPNGPKVGSSRGPSSFLGEARVSPTPAAAKLQDGDSTPHANESPPKPTPPPTAPRNKDSPPSADPAPPRLPNVATAASARPGTPSLVKPKQLRAKPPPVAARGPPPPATRGPPPPATRGQPPRAATPQKPGPIAPHPAAGGLVPPPAVKAPPPAVRTPPPIASPSPTAAATDAASVVEATITPPAAPPRAASPAVGGTAEACSECGQPVGSDCLRLFGKIWHLSCFKCSICAEPFDEDSYVLEIKGNPICKADYDKAQAKKCARCEEPVIDDFVDVMDNLWHVSCFTCAKCNAPLTTGFFKRQGQAVCRACKNLVPK